jgi:hypothetical protein
MRKTLNPRATEVGHENCFEDCAICPHPFFAAFSFMTVDPQISGKDLYLNTTFFDNQGERHFFLATP